MNTNDYNQFYSKTAKVYNQSRMDDKENFSATLNLINKYLNNESLLLDIGCGTGVYGEELQKSGATVIGIDKSEHQVFEAQKRINVSVADARKLPFDESMFDVCTMIMMIHQLEKMDREKAFSEVYRVLKLGGKLIIKTASHEDLMHRFICEFFPSILEIDQKRYPDNKDLEEQLSMFDSVEIKQIQLKISSNKNEWINKLMLRGGSNLGLISDEEFAYGIEKIKKTYLGDDIILRDNWHTFFIATK